MGPRKDGPFVAQNCAAIPQDLLESELFGYVPGAFSGAQRLKKSLLELAHGGTFFLDEVAELEPYHPGLDAEPPRPGGPGGSLREVPASTELSLVRAALGEAGGNVSHAAKALGIDRQQLQRLIKKHQI